MGLEEAALLGLVPLKGEHSLVEVVEAGAVVVAPRVASVGTKSATMRSAQVLWPH